LRTPDYPLAASELTANKAADIICAVGKKKLAEVREYHTPENGIFFKAKRYLYSEKSPYQKIEIFDAGFIGRVLMLDGLVQTTTSDEFFYHEMLVHPAMTSHPGARDVLIIGGGDGGALRAVLRYPVKSATLVEIDGQVVEACRKYFPWLSPALRDRRARLEIADGNRYVRENGRRFDVVLVDSSDPVGPSAILHQREFYARLKDCLRPKGIVAAQAGSPLYHLDHLKKKRVFLGKLFRFALYYLGPVPTYPGGLWCYAFLSDRVNPLKAAEKSPPAGLRYYNLDIHRAAFALPRFLQKKT
jgi:spermidine synthase